MGRAERDMGAVLSSLVEALCKQATQYNDRSHDACSGDHMIVAAGQILCQQRAAAISVLP
jgi:hypothetical protein